MFDITRKWRGNTCNFTYVNSLCTVLHGIGIDIRARRGQQASSSNLHEYEVIETGVMSISPLQLSTLICIYEKEPFSPVSTRSRRQANKSTI